MTIAEVTYVQELIQKTIDAAMQVIPSSVAPIARLKSFEARYMRLITGQQMLPQTVFRTFLDELNLILVALQETPIQDFEKCNLSIEDVRAEIAALSERIAPIPELYIQSLFYGGDSVAAVLLSGESRLYYRDHTNDYTADDSAYIMVEGSTDHYKYAGTIVDVKNTTYYCWRNGTKEYYTTTATPQPYLTTAYSHIVVSEKNTDIGSDIGADIGDKAIDFGDEISMRRRVAGSITMYEEHVLTTYRAPQTIQLYAWTRREGQEVTYYTTTLSPSRGTYVLSRPVAYDIANAEDTYCGALLEAALNEAVRQVSNVRTYSTLLRAYQDDLPADPMLYLDPEGLALYNGLLLEHIQQGDTATNEEVKQLL